MRYANLDFVLDRAGLSVNRYSGKTQKEVVDYVRSNFIKRQPFQRLVKLRCFGSCGVLATGSIYLVVLIALPFLVMSYGALLWAGSWYDGL